MILSLSFLVGWTLVDIVKYFIDKIENKVIKYTVQTILVVGFLIFVIIYW